MCLNYLTRACAAPPQVSVNACDSLHRETALTMASAAGHKPLVETLLRRGGAVGATNSQGAPPLLGAVREGHWDICVVLLGQGALLEQTDDAGRTALMVAAGEGHMGVLDLLLSKGTNRVMVERQVMKSCLLRMMLQRCCTNDELMIQCF